MHLRAMGFMIAVLLLLAPGLGRAADGWTFQVGSGDAYSFPSRLEISQDGQPDIDLTARYQTKALTTQAIYYDFKLGYWKDGAAWEFESLHHKIYLKNKPSEVQRFQISHGYNMNTVNRAWEIGPLIYRVGGGFVMTHPETTIRGKTKEDDGGVNGFYISGLSAQGSIEKRIPIYAGFYLSLEAKATLAYAIIPIWGGEARVPSYALHGIGAIGYAF